MTQFFKYGLTYLDYGVFYFKRWIGPEAFVTESSLACDLRKVNMNEDKEKLSEIFIKLDRVEAVYKIGEVFSGFPSVMTLLQFLEICEFKGLNWKDFEKDEIRVEVEKCERIEKMLREKKEKGIVQRIDERALKEKEWEKELLDKTEMVLMKDRKYYQEKIRRNKSERYTFALEQINEELKKIQVRKKEFK